MLRRLLLVAVLLLTQLVVAAPALAQNTTAESAARLSSASPSAGDTLIGNSGGAFRYYAIDYPGGGVPVPISMRAQPGRGTAGVATGFKIYGPAGFFGDAIGDDRSTSDSSYVLTLAHGQAGTYYIQVYNFIEGLPLSFQLTVSGLPGPAAPVGAPVSPAAQSASPQQPAATNAATNITTGGQLAPNGAGSFAYYDLDYPGGRGKMTITLGYSPLPFNSEKLVGFNLYKRDADSTLVASSTETGRNESSATEGFTLEADEADTYLLQVFSYSPDVPITYTLIVTGLTGPVVEVGDLSDPSRAFAFQANTINARGRLPGNRVGRFHYFLVPYPGANREVRITITFDPAAVSESEVGFNLFKDADRVGIAGGRLAGKGKRVATLTINETDARTFGLQIYNYSEGQDVRYQISVTGL